ncbi:hypothetical protein BG006_004311, partial [Podila minutissima]
QRHHARRRKGADSVLAHPHDRFLRLQPHRWRTFVWPLSLRRRGGQRQQFLQHQDRLWSNVPRSVLEQPLQGRRSQTEQSGCRERPYAAGVILALDDPPLGPRAHERGRHGLV